MEIRAGFDLHFRLCENRGFAPSSRREQLPTGQLHLMGWSQRLQPANNRFTDCPLEPLEYRIMLVIRAGLEPSITALKGLISDHLDERTVLGSVSCCGARQGLRLTKQACPLPTAATRAARFFCHRQCSHRSPPDQATVVTRISSMRTLSSAARTIRLSTVGRAVPFCHL